VDTYAEKLKTDIKATNSLKGLTNWARMPWKKQAFKGDQLGLRER